MSQQDVNTFWGLWCAYWTTGDEQNLEILNDLLIDNYATPSEVEQVLTAFKSMYPVPCRLEDISSYYRGAA